MQKPYTVRFAHLKDPVAYKEGDIIERGDVVGIMGNTGQSTGAHLHIDVVFDRNLWMYRMRDIDRGMPEPAFEQLHYFIDRELGNGDFRVTTFPYDYRYIIPQNGGWKPHPGYDVVLDTPDKRIYWNRSMTGVVAKTGFDSGYGNYVYIIFRA
jgi:murein DD-endopeptidase MepM/ murein hydrolase activator NlpD